MRQSQTPKRKRITPAHIFKRNPIGNGSAAVIRREVFDDIAYRPPHETERNWYFDEAFRQSEDIECWLRIALTTHWRFEGIAGHLTRYRINEDGLSAATDRQFGSWQKMVAKLTYLDPEFFAKNLAAAKAYQFRYLCRRSIKNLDPDQAYQYARDWMQTSSCPLWEEPVKSLSTYLAMQILRRAGSEQFNRILQIFTQKELPNAHKCNSPC